MSVETRRPDFGIVFFLNRGGGDKEERSDSLYAECYERMKAAVIQVASDPKYAEIEPRDESGGYELITRRADGQDHSDA